MTWNSCKLRITTNILSSRIFILFVIKLNPLLSTFLFNYRDSIGYQRRRLYIGNYFYLLVGSKVLLLDKDLDLKRYLISHYQAKNQLETENLYLLKKKMINLLKKHECCCIDDKDDFMGFYTFKIDCYQPSIYKLGIVTMSVI